MSEAPLPHPIALLALALATTGCQQDEPEADDDSNPAVDPVPLNLRDSAAVDAAMGAEISAGIVGLGVGIAVDGEVVFLGGYGFEDRELGVAVDPSSTMFRWASLSKGLTGVIAAQGVAAGEVDLDADVATLVSEYKSPTTVLPTDCFARSCAVDLPDDKRTVTLRMLLSHVGGAPHYGNGTTYPVPSAAQANNPSVNTGMAWALPLWIDEPLVSVPGTKNNYSTFGYNLAGVAVERARDASIPDLVARDVSAPLGITSLQPDYQWVDIPHRAVGYVPLGDDKAVQPIDSDVSWKLSGGGFISTIEDITRYCGGLNAGLLLPAATRDAELWRAQYPALDDYAFGFSMTDTLTGVRASHTGSQEKTRTALAAWPEEKLCITVMTNTEDASPWALLTKVAAAWRSEQ